MKQYTLKSICDYPIVYGIVQAGPNTDDGVPYVRSTDLVQEIELSSLLRTTEALHYKNRSSAVEPGDLIISLRGNIGQTRVLPDSIPVANLTQGTARLRIADSASSKYIYFYSQTDSFEKSLGRITKGSSLKEISLHDLRKIKIPLPPLPTQRRIAAILQTWDRATQLAEQQLADLQERKRGLMQLLLTGKKRLPEFEGKEEWREVRAKKLFTPISDKGFGDLPVLSVLQEGGVVLRDSIERRISFDKSTTGTYKRVKPGDFIISLRSFQGGIEMSEIEGLVSPAYNVMRTTDKALDAFFAYYLKTDNFIRRLDSVIYGIRDGKSISYNDFSFLKISIPSISEQKAIVKILDRESVLETNLTEEVTSLRLQKRGLMQRLLEGEVEVGEELDEILGIL